MRDGCAGRKAARARRTPNGASEAEQDPADSLRSPTLGDIFRRYGPDYRRNYAAWMPRDRMKELGLFRQIPRDVWTKNWVVHSKPVGDGRRALRYLTPYV